MLQLQKGILENTLQQKYNRINYEIKAFVFASLDCVSFISQGRQPRVYIRALHVHIIS